MVSPYFVYRNRFCGLPNGVAILPRFAAIVCNVMIGIKYCLRSIISNTNIAKGTNVINATSLVMNIDEKNGNSTKIRKNTRNCFLPDNKHCANTINTLHCFNPAITAIKQNNKASTRTSIKDNVSMLGGTKIIDMNAEIAAIHNTFSFFINSIMQSLNSCLYDFTMFFHNRN